MKKKDIYIYTVLGIRNNGKHSHRPLPIARHTAPVLTIVVT